MLRTSSRSAASVRSDSRRSISRAKRAGSPWPASDAAETLQKSQCLRRGQRRLVLDGIGDPAQQVGAGHRSAQTRGQLRDRQRKGARDVGENLVLIDFIELTESMRTVSRKPVMIASSQGVSRWCKFATSGTVVATRAPPQYKLPQMTAAPDNYPLLESINSPADLRRLAPAKLTDLADELRAVPDPKRQHPRGPFCRRLGHGRAHDCPALCIQHSLRPAGLGRRPPGLSA